MTLLKIHRPVIGKGFTSADMRYIVDWMEKFSSVINSRYPNLVSEEIYEHRIDDHQRNDICNRLLSAPTYDGRIGGNLISFIDCFFIVENTQTQDFVVFTVDERHHALSCHYMFSKHCKAIYRAHYAPCQIKWIDTVCSERLCASSFDGEHIVRPWMFPHYQTLNGNVFDSDAWFRTVQEQRKTSQKDIQFAFGGSGIDAYRHTMRNLESICPDFTIIRGLDYANYQKLLPTIKIGASIWADWNCQSLDLENRNPVQNGEWCYRDMEYLSSGIPFIRQEYEDSVWGGSYIPNVHYISIPIGTVKDAFKKHGTMGVAELYKLRYEEVKDDTDFLEFVSANQIALWDEWFSANATINKTIEVVEQAFDLKNLA